MHVHRLAGLALVASLALPLTCAGQQPQPPASEVTPDRWPKRIEEKGTKYMVYQPQVDSWDGSNYQAHTAVSVLPAGSKDPVFGALELSAVTIIDKQAKVVEFYAIDVLKATFPTAPAMAKQYQTEFQEILGSGPSSMSLDRLQASLVIERYEQKARQVPVNNQPPNLIFTQAPAILVLVDGSPVWQPVEGTLLTRLLNTRAAIIRDSTGIIYLHVLDGYVQSQDLSGPWTIAANVPDAVSETTNQLAQQKVVDLLAGPPDEKTGDKTPALANGMPMILVEATPSELIVTQGAPDWEPLPGTTLQYVKNTTGNVFKDPANQQIYVLVTGRWFVAPGFFGPWQYVPGKSLPAEFYKIPDDSPKENVKASIPGTPQAREAVISDQIPQMATVARSKVQFTSQIDGIPQIQAINGTSLSYVFNSPQPIIQVAPQEWYALQNGVWFTSTWALGPWTVASSVPPAIYSIPPSSSLYYVTYVRVYSATPQYVVVGYTPGYLGTVVDTNGVVVYGTGYTYTPYIGSSVWYSPPVTYGYGASVTYTPWTGWAVGFGVGMAFGYGYGAWGWCAAPYWGAMPYAYGGFAYGAYGGAAAWGPGGWAATSGNMYSHWGSTSAVSRTSGGYNAWTGNAWGSQVGHSYNSVTGRQSVGERGAVQNVYTGNYAYGGRGATYNPTTGVAAAGSRATVGNASGEQTTVGRGVVAGPGGQTAHVAQVGNNYYASHDGNVYKDSGNGFQQLSSSGWNNVAKGQDGSLQSQAQSRDWGDQRSAASAWSGNSWGDGFDHSGSGGWDRGGMDHSGFDSGGWGGGSRSWGGGGWGGGGRSFGGGGFGGFRR